MQNRKTYFFGWKRNDLSIVTPRFPVISHSAVPRLHVAWISSRSKHSFLHRVFHFRLGALHVNIFLISVNSRRRCNLSLAICLPSDRSRIRFSSFSSSMNSFFYVYIFSCFSLLLALFQCKVFQSLESIYKSIHFSFHCVSIIQFDYFNILMHLCIFLISLLEIQSFKISNIFRSLRKIHSSFVHNFSISLRNVS